MFRTVVPVQEAHRNSAAMHHNQNNKLVRRSTLHTSSGRLFHKAREMGLWRMLIAMIHALSQNTSWRYNDDVMGEGM